MAIDFSAVSGGTIFELTPDFLRLVISNVEDACDYTLRNEVKASAQGIAITVVNEFSTLNDVTPGTYDVDPDGQPAQAMLLANDDACVSEYGLIPFAQAGSTVTIDSIATNEVEGSYHLLFGNRGTRIGTFHAVSCDSLGGPNPTCVP
jgi:hypothetical protein